VESGCTSSAADNAPQERGDPLCTIADVGNRAKPRSPAVWADERLVDEIVELVVGLQERIGPLPQLGIAHAFAIQDCGAFREVMVVYSLQENSLRARRVKRHGMLLRPSTTSRFRSSMRHLRLGLSKKSKEDVTDKSPE
jgi:hypothetical protein